MKLLYISVHQILEYDEIRALQALGHTVFSLGAFFGGTPAEPFRPEFDLGRELPGLMNAFERLGGRYTYGKGADGLVLPRAFVELFDVSIVMQDLKVIEQHWDSLSARPIVWRCVGSDIEGTEIHARPLRERGCYIVRYSPVEQKASQYLGHDAIIRFPKNSSEFRPWIGNEPRVLIFSHALKRRFPAEYDFFAGATEGLPYLIGGAGNEELQNATGLVTYEEQLRLLSTSSAYFCLGGNFLPYTINFVEAWMSGIPVVALDARAVYSEHECKFAEIPNLIKSGETGYVVENIGDAKRVLAELIADRALAQRIGKAGREAAKSHFSYSAVLPQWRELLSKFDNSWSGRVRRYFHQLGF